MSRPDLPSDPADLAAFPVPSLGEVDAELLALPDPPRRERTLTVFLLGFTALASLAMVFVLARDAAYALAPDAAVDVGDLRLAAPTSFGENHFVRAQGLLAGTGAIRYERPFAIESYRLAPIAGREDVWVETRVPSGQENARFVPPSSFSGRLVRFDAAGPRHRGLRTAIHSASGAVVPEGAWLLVDAETPGDARWAVALVLLFLGFAGWNSAAMARLMRKIS